MATTRTTKLRERMRQDIQLAGLSERTQDAYLRAVRQFAEHFRTPPDRLTEEQLREYFLFLKNEKHFASASLALAFHGIRFFYRRTVPRDWETLKQLRIPKSKTLPDVLSPDEVRRLIDAVRTPPTASTSGPSTPSDCASPKACTSKLAMCRPSASWFTSTAAKGQRTATPRCPREQSPCCASRPPQRLME
jgi:integrase